MRLHRALADFELDGDTARIRSRLEDTAYPGLWWPHDDFRHILELTAETCEKYEIGELDGDTAADIIFAALRECETLNPVFGWRGSEDIRFVFPTTPMVVRFVAWAARQPKTDEMRPVSRSLVRSGVKSILRGRKPL